jgi:hypothetical protein
MAKLSDNEISRVNQLIVEKGVTEAQKILHIYDLRTIARAVFGQHVSHMTVQVIRSTLDKI